jgi:hypothetical protein
MVPVQQPLGHVLESHAQVPFVLSHRPLPHALQSVPEAPHCELDSFAYAMQAPLTVAVQQPPEHDAESHTHWPVVLHAWPPLHGPHAAPPVPHAIAFCDAYGVQVPFTVAVQQPMPQEVASHTHWPEELHSWPLWHATHATPPVPHEACAEVTHWPLESQHPVGHELASHTHEPETHSWPVGHILHATPLAPHAAFEDVSHEPALEQQPMHAAPPQVQAPLEHELPVAHAPHALPPVPHLLDDCEPYVTHAPFASQHPMGHVVAPHVGPVSLGASPPPS